MFPAAATVEIGSRRPAPYNLGLAAPLDRDAAFAREQAQQVGAQGRLVALHVFGKPAALFRRRHG
jgi:hypothetical protein